MTTSLHLAVGRPTAVPGSAVAAWLRATRAELGRMLRPGFAGIGVLLLAALTVMATTAAFAGDIQGPGLGRVPVDLGSSRGLTAGLSMATSILGIVVLALWAVAAAGDFGTGWIRLMVQAEPRRGVLLAGKLTALVLLTLAGTLVATVVSVAAAVPMAQASGIVTDAWAADAVATILGGWGNLSLALLAWGVIGFAVAVVTRSATVAIAGGIGYMVVFEGMLALVAEDLTTWLPGSVLAVLSAGGSPDMPWVTALGLAGTYMTLGLAAAAVAFIRRDITA